MSKTRGKIDLGFYYGKDLILPLPGIFTISFIKKLIFLFFLYSSLGNPILAAAHGTDYRILETDYAVTVECLFAGGEPMQYAQVLLFSPDDAVVEFQNGRTDQQGRFAFLPHVPGTWRMKVKDGMGHALTADIKVLLNSHDGSNRLITDASETILQKGLFNGVPGILRASLAISFLFNFFLTLSIFKKKSQDALLSEKRSKGKK